MRIKLLIFSLIIFLSSAVSAKIVISSPYINNIKTNKIELGATPYLYLKYKNDSSVTVYLHEIDIDLVYDGGKTGTIDQITNFNNVSSDFTLKSVNYYTPGALACLFGSNGAPVGIGPGQTIDLAKITFHINQNLPRDKINIWTKLFHKKFLDELAVAAEADDIFIEGSDTPNFGGIQRTYSVDFMGIENQGKNQIIEWNPGTDRTPPVKYRLLRRKKGGNWEIRLLGEGKSSYQDGSYFSPLSDGTIYEYAVTAYDSCSPVPNETPRVVVQSVPMDITPPGEVKDLKSYIDYGPEYGFVKVEWKNPPDPDLAGIIVVRNDNRRVGGGLLGTGQAVWPYKDGPADDLYEYDEPFGTGNGYIVYKSYPEVDPNYIPTFFDDYDVWQGVHYHYKVFTYDYYSPYEPRDMGGNISKGVETSIDIPEEAAFSSTADLSHKEPAPKLKIWFGNRVYQYMRGRKYFVPVKPKIKLEATIPEPYTLPDRAISYYLKVDNDKVYSFSDIKFVDNRAVLSVTLPDKLSPGRHEFSFFAPSSGKIGASSTGSQNAEVEVSGGDLRIMKNPLSFPSPFSPSKNQLVTIQYPLSEDANIKIIIFSQNTEIIKVMSFRKGEEGGAGQLNKVFWDGRTDRGRIAANGIYWANIIDADSNRPLAKLKIAVFN
ncbi:MAG: hypothetical protein U9R38_05015 [Candidatus Margulisiibacteriota bacterium]|nr:hypothetical protein [Candidatus Margulisiibacteriota bacterium]